MALRPSNSSRETSYILPRPAPASSPTLWPFGADVVSSVPRHRRSTCAPPANTSFHQPMRRPEFPLPLIAHASVWHAALSPSIRNCSGSTRRQAQARAQTQRHSHPAALARRPLLRRSLRRGNAVRTPAGILHSFLAGALRIPLAAAGRSYLVPCRVSR
ncbi:hypothetical protein B0H13DRAFT_339033 [Mycena leptocephala]|nr:hypothetical protein B0H13DRAFT_339033 [Mycena leptocephala]